MQRVENAGIRRETADFPTFMLDAALEMQYARRAVGRCRGGYSVGREYPFRGVRPVLPRGFFARGKRKAAAWGCRRGGKNRRESLTSSY